MAGFAQLMIEDPDFVGRHDPLALEVGRAMTARTEWRTAPRLRILGRAMYRNGEIAGAITCLEEAVAVAEDPHRRVCIDDLAEYRRAER